MNTINQSITESVSETRTLVDTKWTELVQCQIDKPCCQYSKTTWINNTIKISTKRKQVHEWTDKWFEFEQRRKEIEIECPMNAYPQCPSDEAGLCWDGTDRAASTCGCPAKYFVGCPATPCEDGLPRSLEDCSCPELTLLPIEPEVILPIEPEVIVPTIDPTCENTGKCTSGCVNTGTGNTAACVFPFKYYDVEYNGCTNMGTGGVGTWGDPWCATEVVSDGSFEINSGNWIACEESETTCTNCSAYPVCAESSSCTKTTCTSAGCTEVAC